MASPTTPAMVKTTLDRTLFCRKDDCEVLELALGEVVGAESPSIDVVTVRVLVGRGTRDKGVSVVEVVKSEEVVEVEDREVEVEEADEEVARLVKLIKLEDEVGSGPSGRPGRLRPGTGRVGVGNKSLNAAGIPGICLSWTAIMA